MPVGKNDCADLIAVLGEVGNVGYNDVNAEEFLFGEHQAGIDDDDVVLPSQGEAVHSELAQPSQRDYPQFVLCHLWRFYTAELSGPADRCFAPFAMRDAGATRAGPAIDASRLCNSR